MKTITKEITFDIEYILNEYVDNQELAGYINENRPELINNIIGTMKQKNILDLMRENETLRIDYLFEYLIRKKVVYTEDLEVFDDMYIHKLTTREVLEKVYKNHVNPTNEELIRFVLDDLEDNK